METLMVLVLGACCTLPFPIGLVLLALASSRRLWPFGRAPLLTWVLAVGTASVTWIWAWAMLPLWLIGWYRALLRSGLGDGYLAGNPDPEEAAFIVICLVAVVLWLGAAGLSVVLSGLQGALVFRLCALSTMLCGVLWLLPLGYAHEEPDLLMVVGYNAIFLIPCELGLLGLLVTDLVTGFRQPRRSFSAR